MGTQPLGPKDIEKYRGKGFGNKPVEVKNTVEKAGMLSKKELMKQRIVMMANVREEVERLELLIRLYNARKRWAEIQTKEAEEESKRRKELEAKAAKEEKISKGKEKEVKKEAEKKEEKKDTRRDE